VTPRRIHGSPIPVCEGMTEEGTTCGTQRHDPGYEPFAHIDREGATVGALRDQARDVDTTIRTKQEWRALYEAQAS
jgi:hypothetical protein